jgi:NAD(P)-dependent dehydrogenase (short-subunit alcohol dehydrogenase family)
MATKKRLSEQVVVVAGGSYGLGRAIVRAVADRGAKVAVGARDREALDAAVGEVEAAGSEAIAIEVDVSMREQVDRLVEQAASETDPAKRVQTYRQLEQILIDQQAVQVPLFEPTQTFLLSKRLKNFVFEPSTGPWVDRMWLDA